MEIVCPGWFPGAEGLVEAIPLLANQGATEIEINLNSSDSFDRHDCGEVESLIAILADSGLRVHSIHSPHGADCDISNLDDEVHERGVDAIIESIELASMLESQRVIVHASHRLQGPPNGRFERARGVMRELSLVAMDSGIVLALENLPPGYLGHSADELLELLDGCEKKGIGICFDAGHANLSGHLQEFARALLPRSVTVNVHDNDGSKDQHMFPGQGSIDWAAFGDIYRACGCNAGVMLECPPPENTPWNEAFQQLRLALGD